MYNNYNELDKESILKKVCVFFKMDYPNLHSSSLKEGIKEICVARLCKSIGIRCEYNYKSAFFEFFSQIIGEAVCKKLNIRLTIAPDCLRLFKYEHYNLVDTVGMFINFENIDEGIIESFNFINKYTYLIPQLTEA